MLLHNKDSTQKEFKLMAQRGEKDLTTFPHFKTQREKNEKKSLLNTLNLPPRSPGAVVVLGTIGLEMPNPAQAAGVGLYTLPHVKK